ncbi:membrane protein insertase YidC [Salipaludibacillus sp. HK11]|uniref:membrane protein insertase YidC n=1 Tax=Salipaludibacillus sp. HK11 TaxID=3394320 RepID=UPI0039FD0DA4
MGKKSVFTRLSKYSALIVIGGLLLLVFSGCQASFEPVDADTAGVFNHYIIYPISFLIKFLAGIFSGNYGLSIVFTTLLIRSALLPLMMKQYKTQMLTREKMAIIQPEMNDLKEKYKDKKSAEDKQNMQKEMMELYQTHNFNPITSMGCLPMLIQFPILIGFYQAIMRTPEIAEHSFLWFNLGTTDMILPFLAAGVYFFQFRVSQKGMQSSVSPTGTNAAQQKQMAMLGYLTPILMGVFSFNVAAALPLYWTVGGLFLIFQTVLFKWMYREKKPALKPAVETD